MTWGGVLFALALGVLAFRAVRGVLRANRERCPSCGGLSRFEYSGKVRSGHEVRRVRQWFRCIECSRAWSRSQVAV